MTDINQVLQCYGMSLKEKELFKSMVKQEGDGFLGYHGGSHQARLFQDILFFTIRDLLEIPVREDFVFLRIPDDSDLKYQDAQEFLSKEQWNLAFGSDIKPHIQKHLLSLNRSLYQSFDQPWDLTPRYFLENETWTHPQFIELLIPFFEKLGVTEKYVEELWAQGEALLPRNRGFILQIFDKSNDFAFAKKCSYAALSGGKPHRNFRDHHHLNNDQLRSFPQIRLVLGQKTTLNPSCPLSFIRYDVLTEKMRDHYQLQLSNLIKKLPYDADKVQLMKLKLLSLWEKL